MRKLARSCILASILSALAATASKADVILSVSGPRGTSYTIGAGTPVPNIEILAVSWSQTQSYSNVAISAMLNAIQPGNTVDAYLVRGTVPQPVANQVAHSTFAIMTGDANYTLFSGLTLGAGTYSLVLDSFTSQPDTVGWISTRSPTIVKDTGVTLPHALYGSGGNSSQPPYAPNAPNFGFSDSIGNLEFTVQSVPEPATLLTSGISASLFLAFGANRRFRSTSSTKVT
jgi:hypothetical protein